jgi:predicted ester cyclase
MSAEENKAIVRRYFEELWNKGDLAFIEECMGPDITHAWGHETHESWRAAVSAWLTAFPDFHYHVDDLVAEGDTVAANTHFTATHRGVYQWRKDGPWLPTGKSIDVREMIFFHFADGKIVRHFDAWNSTAFEQLLAGEPAQATTTT